VRRAQDVAAAAPARLRVPEAVYALAAGAARVPLDGADRVPLDEAARASLDEAARASLDEAARVPLDGAEAGRNLSVGARDEVGGHWVESAMDDQPRDVSEQPDPAWASTEGALVQCDPGLAISGGAVLATGLAGRRPVLVCC